MRRGPDRETARSASSPLKAPLPFRGAAFAPTPTHLDAAFAGLPSGTCGLCHGAVAYCAGLMMPPAATRVVRGYVMDVAHLAFSAGDVSGNSQFMGCVSYGQWRTYAVQSTGMADAQLFVTIEANVGGMYAAAGRQPTLTDYDLLATPPLRELFLVPCDVSLTTTWHIAVSRRPPTLFLHRTSYPLSSRERRRRGNCDAPSTQPLSVSRKQVMLGAESEGIDETLFTLTLRTASARAQLGVDTAYSGGACCGGYSYWAVPAVPDHAGKDQNSPRTRCRTRAQHHARTMPRALA